MVLEKIREALSEQFDCSPEDITEDTNIIEDLGADSLDLVELISELENEYCITVTDEAIYDCHTVGQIVRCIEKLIV